MTYKKCSCNDEKLGVFNVSIETAKDDPECIFADDVFIVKLKCARCGYEKQYII